MFKRFSSNLSPLLQSSFYQASHCLRIMEAFSRDATSSVQGGTWSKEKQRFIAFVLGGPGSGKGTQCTKMVETYGLTHLSAGALLRNEISSNSENGSMILDIIKVGKIVPSEVTVKLIQNAISATDNHKFLIDGFPRTEENRLAYEQIMENHPMYPYNLTMFHGEPVTDYVERVRDRCSLWGNNYIGGLNNYYSTPRRIDVLLKTIPNLPPWIPIKEKYNDVLTEDGEINSEKYKYLGVWYLKLDYVATKLIEAFVEWNPDGDDFMGEVIDEEEAN